MHDREELAQIIDHNAFVYDPNDHTMTLATRQSIVRRRSEALAKADLWLSRPSPVDGVVAASRILIRGIWQGAFGHWHITGGDPESVVTNLQNAVAAYDKAKGETQ